MRSGDEPAHARSPLRLRLALALFGLLAAVAGTVAFVLAGEPVLAVAFAVVAVIAALDLAVVRIRLRQGPHYQPGPDVPAYRPVEDDPVPRPPREPVSQRTRTREYLALMGLCVGLLLVAWVGLRPVSTTAAIVVSIVAMVIPPVAAIFANVGARPGRRD